jgi:hypothetical protein
MINNHPIDKIRPQTNAISSFVSAHCPTMTQIPKGQNATTKMRNVGIAIGAIIRYIKIFTNVFIFIILPRKIIGAVSYTYNTTFPTGVPLELD